MSFYLKYRPQTFAQLDLNKVRTELLSILSSGTYSHAYLFAGPKGTGKTSAARILAKVLNCQKNQKALKDASSLNEPCNNCDSCKAITVGSSLAVIEMDAASNRGIDDIRQLKERVGLAPAQGSHTIYVIDEVHMLTKEAFNALLKTLEEPPAHAVFVLATTEPQSLPDTILSRCTQISFTKALPAEVKNSLQKAVEGEKIKIDAKALDMLAQRVDGSFRDGMKLLEQLQQAGETISLDAVNQLTGYSELYDVSALTQHLMSKNTRAALEDFAARLSDGIDAVLFTKRATEHVRDLLLISVSQNNPTQVRELLELTDLLSKAAVKAKRSVISSLPLEMAIVAWCLSSTQSATQRDRADEGDASEPPLISTKQTAKKSSLSQAHPNPGKDSRAVLSTTSTPQADFSSTIADVRNRWDAILEQIKKQNFTVEALLKSARPQAVSPTGITIEVLYAFHKEQLEQHRFKDVVETIVQKEFGQKCKVEYVLVGKTGKGSNVTGKVADESIAKAAADIFG